MTDNAKTVLAHRRIAVQKAQFRAAEGLMRIKQVASGSLRRSTPKNSLLRSAFRDGRLYVIARSKLENGKSGEELPTKADTERTVELLRMEINAQSPQQQFHSVTVGVLIDRFLHLGAHEYDTTEKPHGFNAGVALQASLLAMLRVG